MSELEESLKRNRALELQKQRIKDGYPATEKRQIEQLRETLPFFLNEPALSTVSKVLEMVQGKLETKEQLREFRQTLDTMQTSIKSAASSGAEVRMLLSNVEKNQLELNALLSKYVRDNERAVDALNNYLKDWS